jgi:hypothetical protein
VADDRFDIAIGDTVSEGVPAAGAGNIEQPGTKDLYFFEGTAGQAVYLQALGSSGDLSWYLYDPNGNYLASAWIGYDLGRIDLTQMGTYRIEVWGGGGPGTGPYSFALNGLRPPVGGGDFSATETGVSVNLPIARLLANDTDPDGDVVRFDSLPSGSTAEGGTVTILDSVIRYRPKSGFSGTDSFTYQINDGWGNLGTATVTVQVREPETLGLNTISATRNPDGSIALTMAGIAGQTYQLWYAPDVALGPWTLLDTVVADANGIVSYTDTSAIGVPVRFYRLAQAAP